MKLDLLDVCENQNIKTLNGISSLKENLITYKDNITNNTDKVIEYLSQYFKEVLSAFTQDNEIKNYYGLSDAIISNHYTEEEWNELSEEEQKDFLNNLYEGIAFRQAVRDCDYEITFQDYNPPTVEF